MKHIIVPTLYRKSKKQSVSLPHHVEDGEKKKVNRAIEKRSKWVNIRSFSILFDQILVSERARKVVWMAALLTIFILERRRTFLRMKRASNVTTKIISGIIIESPEDSFPTTHEFMEVRTGTQVFDGTKVCSRDTSAPPCQITFPFVDLNEFQKQHGRKRLKQAVQQLPTNQRTYAILTQRGIGVNHQNGNQDRAMVMYPFYPFETRIRDSTDFLLCLLDGHGPDGHTIADTAVLDVSVSLSKELNKAMTAVVDNTQLHRLMTQILIKTFHKVDRHIQDSATSGATMTVALKLGDHLHIANVGDSQTFVVAYKDEAVEILYATRPDKPDIPDERQRILSSGGSLWLPPLTSRGVQPPPQVYLEFVDEQTNVTSNYVLGLSRSIGDRVAHSFGVVADPIVASLQVSAFSDRQLFVFSASDGLLEKMAALTIAERLAASLYRDDTVSTVESIEGILLDANEAWTRSRVVENGELKNYRDDMTLAVVKVLP
jgi:serine/threonine protein phosphatase PrpC